MKTNIWFWVGIAYLAFILGILVAHIGDIPQPSTPWTGINALQVLILFVIPFLSGYLGGRDE